MTLNGSDLEYTVAGRATGTSQISNTIILMTISVNSLLTITPLAGGTRPVSAHLVMLRIE